MNKSLYKSKIKDFLTRDPEVKLMVILGSTLLMLILGLVLGAILAIFARVFKEEEDPAIAKILDILPAYNCGFCGFPGCKHLADALVKGLVPSNRCTPGGRETGEKIDLILGSRKHETGQTV